MRLPSFLSFLARLRRIAALVVFAAAFPALVHAQAPAGLVAAYGFNEGAGTSTADATGNGLTGTAASATWVAGKFGNALQFTGATNSRVTVANSPLLQFTNAFTLSAWINPAASLTAEPTVIAKEIPGNLPYVLYARGPGVGPNAYALVGGTYRTAAAPSAIPANTWTYLAATYNGSTLSVFVNGVLTSSAAVSGSLSTGTGALRIGSNAVFGGEGFNGRIDEVRVYNRALSAAEIQSDMNTPVGGTPPPLDTTPPTGTVQINAGAASTNQTAVTLTLAASDNATGVAQMRFSNDGVTFSTPVAFATSAAWVLTSGDGTKTVSAQFRDGAGNWSNTSTDTIVLDTTPPPDTTPPTGSVLINAGAASTNQTAVTLTLAASDNATGVAEMRFSNDGVTFSTPVAFATSAAWVLTSGDGTKTVSAQFRDGAGNWSNTVADTIVLSTAPPPDTTPPTGAVQINAGAASTSQTAVTLNLSATDNATGVAEMRFSNDGVTFSTPVAFAATAAWVLTAGNGTKTVSAQFRDGAGNWSNAFTDTIVLSTGPSANPQLGAHVLLAQNEFAGTNPAITPPITTQNGSTLLALSMGWLRNLSNPVDSFGNTWTSVSGPNIYFSSDFYTALWAVPSAVGGAGHTLRFDKQQYPAGEISMALIEVTHGGLVDVVYQYAPASNQSPGSITVDGPATLIAVWGGDAFALDNTAVPDNGFTVIDSYLDFGNGDETAVQVAIAAKEVTAAGTYTVRWTSTPTQACACYLIAVRNQSQPPPTDTTPPTGSIQINGGAASTNQAAVTLTLAASDNATVVAQMRFSNDGVNFSAPVAFATTAAWVLSSGDGAKTVSAQFRDGAGNWSSAVAANITLSTTLPVSSLVAAYGFNEGQGVSAADASGNSLTGAVSNATWVPGKFGNALQFSGATNSHVTIASSPLLQFTTAFTLSAWVNPAVAQSAEPTVMAKEISGDLPYVFYASGSGAGPNAYVLAGGAYQNAAAAGTLPANTWTHLAATYSGSTLTVFVNGVAAGSTTVSGNLAAGAGALRIGNNAVFANEGFIGGIDEVRLYNRALSAAEIQADMVAPVGTTP